MSSPPHFASPKSGPPTDVAVAWVIRLSEANVGDADRSAFDAWLQESPEHGRAYSDALRAYSAAGELREFFLNKAPKSRATSFSARPARWIVGATAALAAGLAIVTFMAPQDRPLRQDYQAQIAEVSRLTLEDGSEVTLGPATQMEVNFSHSTRGVRLSRGQAFFHVAQDATRPFVVDMGEAQSEVVGTQFEIKSVCGAVRIRVTEGVVSLNSRAHTLWSMPESGVRLTAGQEADLYPRQAPLVRQSAGVAAGWREGFVSYQDAPLCEVIGDANRYSGTPITIADPSVGALRISVSYPTDQVTAMLQNLDANFPLDVVRRGDGSVDITAAP